MNTIFLSFLDKGYYYNYQNGPNIISSEEQALQKGINCIGLMHLLLKKLFKVELPTNLRVLEIYNENPYFKTVDKIEELQMGDIIFLGRKELPDYINLYNPQYDKQKKLINEDEGNTIIGDKYAGFHTAMYVGEKNKKNEELFVDIERATNKVTVWTLQELKAHEKYKILYKIKRLL